MRSKKAKKLRRRAKEFLEKIGHDDPGEKLNTATGEVRSSIANQLYRRLKNRA